MLWMIGCSVRLKSLPRRSGCMLLNCNVHVNQLPTSSGSYVVASTWSHLQDALGATLYRPLEVTSTTLWMLRCNILFNQLPRSSGSYVVTTTWSHLQDALDATLDRPLESHFTTLWMYVVTSISISFKEALEVTLSNPREVTSKNQVPRRSRCYGITYISSQSERLCMLRCNVFPNKLQDALDATL